MGIQPRLSGLRVQGTASSPPSTAMDEYSTRRKRGLNAAHFGHEMQEGHEPMAVRKHLSLPDGYAAKRTDAWYLFDPQGVRIAGPVDRAAVEEQAWRDAWRRIDQELNDELAALRAGTRSLEDLPRVRQYLRMVDAVERRRAEPAGRSRLLSRGMPVMVAAAAAAAFIIGFIGHETAPVPKPAGHVTPVVAVLPKTPTSPPPAAAVPTTAPRAPAPRSKVTAFAVRIGTFTNATVATNVMHLVRSKGYLVNVVPQGGVSQVVTHPYRTRLLAEGVARGLEDIGLSAHLTAWRL